MKNNNYKRHLEKINPPKYFINGMTLRKYCRENNIPFGTIQRRLAKGMSVEEALKYNKLIKYEEYLASEKYIKHLEEKIKIYERKEKQHTKDSILYNELVEENKELKEILERHKKATAKAQIRSCDLEIINTQLKADCKTLAQKLLQVKPELREWLEVNFKEYL